MKTLANIFTTIAVAAFIMISMNVTAQTTWEVPAADKAKKNPVKATAENIEAGKQVYMIQCKACHGDPGKNNGLPLTPKPTDPLDESYQKMTDGEIYYKMTKGKGAMPSYEKTIKDEDRWKIITYIRSLNK
jgi:mono/diheme cytochrome c family protein